MKDRARLYLIPTAISPEDTPHRQVMDVLPSIDVFICERIRTTRRWLRTVIPDFDIDGRTFLEFDKHKDRYPMKEINALWLQGKICGLTSEAGTPAVADPGHQVVASAHKKNIPVIPLPGNNSLILGLMASGLNGNQFTYHGYFPIDLQDLKARMKSLQSSIHQGYTQIFIETPYRNRKTLEALIHILPGDYRLSISSGLLTPESVTRTLPVKEWSGIDTHYLHKVPAVFFIGN